MLLAGSLVVTGGLVILCVVDCRHGNVLLVCVSLTTGCVAMQYLGVMSLPLELSRGNAAVVGALSSLIANVVKFSASFGLCHVAQSVSQCSSSSVVTIFPLIQAMSLLQAGAFISIVQIEAGVQLTRVVYVRRYL